MIENLIDKAKGMADSVRDHELRDVMYALIEQAEGLETLLAWSDWAVAVKELQEHIKEQAERNKELEGKYNELIMAVASKYPNKTRHETALDYIEGMEKVNKLLPEQQRSDEE